MKFWNRTDSVPKSCHEWQ